MISTTNTPEGPHSTQKPVHTQWCTSLDPTDLSRAEPLQLGLLLSSNPAFQEQSRAILWERSTYSSIQIWLLVLIIVSTLKFSVTTVTNRDITETNAQSPTQESQKEQQERECKCHWQR